MTKDELLRSVWQGTFVTDNALTRTIVQIRKALGDDAKQGRFIETVPRMGYRFIAGASSVPGPSLAQTGDETVMTPPKGPYVRHWLYGIGLLAALAVMAMAIRRPATPKSAPTINLSPPAQFTTSNGLDLYATFAPDGASLAYSSDESGAFEIYVKRLARAARTIQVTSDGRQNVQPAWSPDGRYLAYHPLSEGGIWVVPALGGSPRKLSDIGNAPMWSPDGSRLVFQTQPFASMSSVDQSCGGAVGGIWVVGAEGGAPRQLPLPRDPDVCKNADPSWTPDGHIVFARRTLQGVSRIASIAPDGSGLRVVTTVKGMVNTPRWLPERASIFFSNFSDAGDVTIRRLPVDSNGQPTGPAEEVISHGIGVPRAFVLSKDGRRLAYTASLPESQLHSLPVKAPGIQPSGASLAITTENIYRYSYPCLSPDGQHLAFTFIRKGVRGDIWVSDIDGRNARPLTATQNHGACAGWLSDSSGVVNIRFSTAGEQLWSASVRDGVERRLSTAQLEGGNLWLSPDGRSVVFHKFFDGGGLVLRKLDLATGRSTDLLSAKDVSAGFGIWSRDGRQIAFELQLDEDVRLATVSSAGGPYTEWTTGHGKTWPGSWSTDGKTIIAAAQRDGVWNVYAVGRDHSEQKLTDYTSPREFVRYPQLSPSGDRIIYEYNETKGNIYIAELQ